MIGQSMHELPISALIAHQGGWDEILLVAGPILIIATLLVVVKRRVDAALRRREAGDSSQGVAVDSLDGGSETA